MVGTDANARIGNAALLLLQAVQADREYDVSYSTWLTAEGERVCDNARALLEASNAGTLAQLLGDATVGEFLGQAWLDVHTRSWDRAEALQALIEREATTG